MLSPKRYSGPMSDISSIAIVVDSLSTGHKATQNAKVALLEEDGKSPRSVRSTVYGEGGIHLRS